MKSEEGPHRLLIFAGTLPSIKILLLEQDELRCALYRILRGGPRSRWGGPYLDCGLDVLGVVLVMAPRGMTSSGGTFRQRRSCRPGACPGGAPAPRGHCAGDVMPGDGYAGLEFISLIWITCNLD